MIDILFASVPYTDSSEPIMAPGLLKSVANAEGFSSVALDLNIEIFQQLKNNPLEKRLIKAFDHKTIEHDLAFEMHKLVKYCGEKILNYRPKIVGLSLLTTSCQVFTVWLSFYLKNYQPGIKIVIGGSGIKNFVASNKNSYCEELKKLGLIDHYIMGDGELALKEFLHGNLSYPGIDSLTWIQPTDISNFPFPDYSDYNFEQYDPPVIPLSDSRGCVRSCEFCDIIEHWKKFVYRSADSLFEEMLYQIEKHNISNFSMRNSLTNGHMKQFDRWLDLIVEYNEGKPRHKQISWQGYFIIREQHQHPEELWDKLKKSNATLHLGVESVIKHVRWEMKKKFTNEAIDYHLEMGKKYQVPLKILMIVGSPSENLEDYEFTKQWFFNRLHYAQDSVIGVNLALASILPGTEWDRKQNVFNIIPGEFASNWTKNVITPKYRANYWKELVDICAVFNTDFKLRQDRALAVIDSLH